MSGILDNLRILIIANLHHQESNQREFEEKLDDIIYGMGEENEKLQEENKKLKGEVRKLKKQNNQKCGDI